MENGEQPAYPILETDTSRPVLFGLTKREYFAGLAMQGIMADGQTSDLPAIATASVMIADELLKALNKQPNS